MQEIKYTKGFTLLELSIVLVIIGLVVGGVLVGRELIHTSEIRKAIGQRDQFEVAVKTFTLKYNCLPGDCATASDVGVGNATPGYGQNGNGSGVLDYAGNENVNFWYHLSKASLIGWTPSLLGNNPSYACSIMSPCLPFVASNEGGYKGGWYVFSPQDSLVNISAFPGLPGLHYWWLVAGIGGDTQNSATISPADAFDIDSKMDDGFPMTGNVFAAGSRNYSNNFGPRLPNIGSGGANTNGCVNNSTVPYSYNVLNLNRVNFNLCSMLIKTGF